jgi:dCMP deaminase
MKAKHIDMYMTMAETAANASYAYRLKVGALAVKDHRILSVGYNGTPPGMDNKCEILVPVGNGEQELMTRRDVIHAEMNLIYKMARDGQSGKDADLFVTHSPCFECSKAILSVGFRKVWFKSHYRDSTGVDFLKSNGIEVEQVCQTK